MPSLAAPVAVVDCGTNSIRLLVKTGSVILERRMETTRLGRDIDRTGTSIPTASRARSRCSRSTEA